MRLLITGYARSGTKSLSEFYRLFIGSLDAGHEVAPMPDTPNFVVEKLKTPLQVEASWACFPFIAEFQKAGCQTLIVTRDPLLACNSMVHYHNNHNKTLEMTSLQYHTAYKKLIDQISFMKMSPEPKFIRFGKYIAGEYTTKLFALLGIKETEVNYDKAREHLRKRINHAGPYDVKYIPMIDKCRDIRCDLESACQEL
jgi:hypothetical protein